MVLEYVGFDDFEFLWREEGEASLVEDDGPAEVLREQDWPRQARL